MTKRLTSRQLFMMLLVLPLMILIVIIGIRSTSAQTSVIPESLALDRALAYAMDDMMVGGAITEPTEVRGRIMNYGQAVQFVFGTPISPNEGTYKIRNYAVWLVVLKGEFIEHVPSSADGSIPSKDVIHDQMVVILDGNTGEIIERVMISPQKALLVSNLPLLNKSSGPLPALPTKGPISTEAPYPTLSNPG